MKNNKEEQAITLIALVITIIVLLVLAGISMVALIGNNGLLTKANTAKETTEEKAAREKLELVLTELGIHKRTDNTYNENEYINLKLKSENMQVEGDSVTVDGWQFEIDRSVPKIVDLAIWNKQDMEDFRDEVNTGNTFEGKVVQVKADIDLENVLWTPIGTTEHNFKGEFDGKNHTINNLYINVNVGAQALFNRNEGIIKNITVRGEITANGGRVAGICVINFGTIENVINHANIYNQSTTEDITGGIVAIQRSNSRLNNCINYGEVKADFYNVGGIVGHANSEGFTIDACHNYGKVISSNASGGIAGNITASGTIQNCINEGEIISKGQASGGILGLYNTSSKPIIIQKCRNKGRIQANSWASGGMIGAVNTIANILECKNEGEIFSEAGNVGGMIGSCSENDNKFYTSNIERCINNGYVHATGNNGTPGCGGMLGAIGFGDNCDINDCYNTGKIESTSYSTDTSHGVGGIMGAVYYNEISTGEVSKVTISNCYNIGDIINSHSSNNAGHILGVDWNNNRRIENCYYLNTAQGTNILGGVGVSEETLKGQAGVLGEAYTTDTKGGYPILKWEI